MSAQTSYLDLLSRASFPATGSVVDVDAAAREFRTLLQDAAIAIARAGEWTGLRTSISGAFAREGGSRIWRSPDLPEHMFKVASFAPLIVTIGSASFTAANMTATHSERLLNLEATPADYGRYFVEGAGVAAGTRSLAIVYDGGDVPVADISFFSRAPIRGASEFGFVIESESDMFRVPEELVTSRAFWMYRRGAGFEFESLRAENDRAIDQALSAQLDL